MNSISIDLIKNPYNFNKWQSLIDSLNHENLTIDDINDIRNIYSEFLKNYPLLVNYYIRYIQFEYNLNNVKKCELIYDQGFKYLSYSIEYWMSYIQFKLTTVPIDCHTVNQILEIFEVARSFIGFNYYSFEFYKLYLDFLLTYQALGDKYDLKYEKLLRFILELPIHNYSYFFKLVFKANFKYFVDKNMKKALLDLYVVTQYKSFKLYDLEKHLLTNYFDVKYISINELKAWEKYLEYIELNYPEFAIQSYERCLIATASYDDIWIKFASFLIAQKKYKYAEHILIKGIYLKRFNTGKLYDMLTMMKLDKGQLLLSRNLGGVWVKETTKEPIPIEETKGFDDVLKAFQ